MEPSQRGEACMCKHLMVSFVTLFGVTLAASGYQAGTDVVSGVDHLVYASPELQTGVEKIEQILGVRATPGGQHPGRGTRNALLSLGPGVYLEIIGPDTEQPEPAQPRPFGIDELKEPRLVHGHPRETTSRNWPAMPGVKASSWEECLPAADDERTECFCRGATRIRAPSWLAGLSRSSSTGARHLIRRARRPREPD